MKIEIIFGRNYLFIVIVAAFLLGWTGHTAFAQYNLQLSFEDKRQNPIIYGELFSRAIVVFGTTHTLRDKKGKLFPAFQQLFTDRLAARGYVADENAMCRLHIEVNDLWIKNDDHYTYMQTYQRCSLTVKLADGSAREILNTVMHAENNSKAKDVRQHTKESDYKLTTTGSIFLIVIDSIISQLVPELESKKSNCISKEVVTITTPSNISTGECQCDIIYKIDGEELRAKVEEITTAVIKYKKIEQPDGPIRSIPINDVFMIVYKDGTKKVFK